MPAVAGSSPSTDPQQVLTRPWCLHPQVALRAEPFGALAYHYGNRRLSFLKSRALLAAVQRLGEEPTAAGACRAAGVAEADLPAYARALARLASAGMICERASDG